MLFLRHESAPDPLLLALSPIVFGVRAHDLPFTYKALQAWLLTAAVPELPAPPALSPCPHLWQSCSARNKPSRLLPRGLCTQCSLSWNSPCPGYLRGCTLVSCVLCEMFPSEWPSTVLGKAATSTPALLPDLLGFVFLQSTWFSLKCCVFY